MTLVTSGDPTLTELDHARLNRLLRRGDPAAGVAVPLAELLDSADLVPSREVAPDVATMYSQMLLAEPGSAARRKLTLCYPQDAEPEAGFVSVLSPVGAALLGQRVGSTVRWRTPLGDERRAEIVAITFQPEASGDFTL